MKRLLLFLLAAGLSCAAFSQKEKTASKKEVEKAKATVQPPPSLNKTASDSLVRFYLSPENANYVFQILYKRSQDEAALSSNLFDLSAGLKNQAKETGELYKFMASSYKVVSIKDTAR